MPDDMLTLDKAVKQSKSSELVKKNITKSLKEMAKMRKLTASETKTEDCQKIKEKYPKILKIRKIPQDFPRRNIIDAANRHIKERNVQLLTSLAGHVRIVVITLQNVKAVILSVDDKRQDGNSDKDCYFLGAVEDNESQTKWSVDLSLGKTQMRFNIDTGADVTIIPEPLYLQTGINNLQKSARQLFGPGPV